MRETDILESPIDAEEATSGLSGSPLQRDLGQRDTVQPESELLERYFSKTSTEADPEAALLGRINGEFMKMFFRLGETIESICQDYPTDAEHLSALLKGDVMRLQFGRQIGQFARLRLVLNNTPKTMARLGKR